MRINPTMFHQANYIVVCLLLTAFSGKAIFGQEIIDNLNLDNNEVISYYLTDNKKTTLELYAESKDCYEKRRFLARWKNTEPWTYLQFSADRKKCIFGVVHEGIVPATIYYFDGVIGSFQVLGNMTRVLVSKNFEYLLYDPVKETIEKDKMRIRCSFYSFITKETKEIVLFLPFDYSDGEIIFSWMRESNEVFLCLVGEGGSLLCMGKYDVKNNSIIDIIDYYHGRNAEVKLTDTIFDDTIQKQWSDPSICINARE